MKKFVLMLCVAAMVFAFTACGGDIMDEVESFVGENSAEWQDAIDEAIGN